jgi:hypothetical protein
MPDFNTWTPYLTGGFAAVIAWLCKGQIQSRENIVKLQTVMEYYIERQTKDAALRLEQLANPTPPDMQILLEKYRRNLIADDERQKLIDWLNQIMVDLSVESGERSAAMQLLSGLKTKAKAAKLFEKKRRWWQFA